jgi:NADPH-dependent glutamate synthase beta subunit-like oxidoreductase
VRQKKRTVIKGSVVVIGGGDVAVDAAICAYRLGAETVEVVCLEQEADMPASVPMRTDAQNEGIRFHFGWGALRFAQREDRISGVVFARCTSYCVEQGEIKPTLSEREYLERPSDLVILAIGEKAHLGSLADGFSGIPEDGPVRVDPTTLATNVPGLYAGGDVAKMPGSVAEAIGAGKRAALHIHLQLNPSAYAHSASDVLLAKGPAFSIEAFFKTRPEWNPQQVIRFDDLNPFCLTPQPPVSIPRVVNGGTFRETIQSLSQNSAIREARRCFFCGACIGCDRCLLFCPDLSIHPLQKVRSSYGHNEDYCKGCGTCAAACLSGVMELGENR